MAAEGRQHSLSGHPVPDLQQVSAAPPGVSSAVLCAFQERSRVTLQPGGL